MILDGLVSAYQMDLNVYYIHPDWVDFGVVYGYDTQAFHNMISAVGSNVVHFFMKGQFDIDSTLPLLPTNVKFTFGENSKITFTESKTQIYSEINALKHQHIFDIVGFDKPTLHVSATDEMSLKWFGFSPLATATYNSKVLKDAVYVGHLIGSFLIPFTTRDTPYLIDEPFELVSYNRENQMVFPSWRLRGEGVGSGTHHDQATSKIKYTGTFGPAINVRGARIGTELHDFELEGLNTKVGEILTQNPVLNTITNHRSALWDVENWVTPGMSIDRYDHLSGIAFDWVGGNIGSLPWSAQAKVRDVKVSNFVVGYTISPNEGAQGDTIVFEDCGAYACTFPFSAGQDQVRAVEWVRPIFEKCYCFMTNTKFGKQNGSLFNMIGGQLTTAFKAFDIGGQFAGQCIISGVYFEAIGILGSLRSTGVNSYAIHITGCDFKIDDNGYTDNIEGRWATPYLHCEGGSNVKFESCTFRGNKGYLSLYSAVNGAFQIDSCAFEGINEIQLDGVSALGNQTKLSFTGKSTFQNMNVDTRDVPHVGNFKTYVRSIIPAYLNTYSDGSVGGTGVVTYLTEPFNLPDKWRINPEPTNPAGKEFTKNLSDAAYYQVGDYVTCLTEGQADRMVLSLGQIDSPSLKVVNVVGNDVTFSKLGPEVNPALTSNGWGKYWTVNRCWISVNPANNLQPGDWFNDGVGMNRIKPDGTPVRSIVGDVRGR